MAPDQYDLVIVGTGSAGMMAAEFAATLELRVALVESHRPGGERLWTGAVPSKALRAAARTAHVVANADRFGVEVHSSSIHLDRVWARVRELRRRIAETDDDAGRLDALGLELVRGRAVLTGPNEVTVHPPSDPDDRADGADPGDPGDPGDEQTAATRVLQGRFVLLCTGSRPAMPGWIHEAGSDAGSSSGTGTASGRLAARVWTSETFFELDEPPASLVVVGGGPMGVELAQACARLGIATTLVERHTALLPRDEPSLTGLLAGVLRAEGVEVLLGVEAVGIRPGDAGVGESTRRGDSTRGDGAADDVVVTVRDPGTGVEHERRADGVLLAVGRRPNLDGLGLEALGLEATADGIVVDERGRTTFRTVYAVGDVASGERFTHAAGHAAVRAVRDMFFPGRSPMSHLVPWCTFTDPELAHVGLTSSEAEARFGDDVDVWRIDLEHSDRARIDDRDTGALVVITAKDRIVGGHLLAPSAGEVIHELALAVERELTLADLADLVHVYPTIAGGVGRLAAEFVDEKAQRYRWLVRRR